MRRSFGDFHEIVSTIISEERTNLEIASFESVQKIGKFYDEVENPRNILQASQPRSASTLQHHILCLLMKIKYSVKRNNVSSSFGNDNNNNNNDNDNQRLFGNVCCGFNTGSKKAKDDNIYNVNCVANVTKTHDAVNNLKDLSNWVREKKFKPFDVVFMTYRDYRFSSASMVDMANKDRCPKAIVFKYEFFKQLACEGCVAKYEHFINNWKYFTWLYAQILHVDLSNDDYLFLFRFLLHYQFVRKCTGSQASITTSKFLNSTDDKMFKEVKDKSQSLYCPDRDKVNNAWYKVHQYGTIRRVKTTSIFDIQSSNQFEIIDYLDCTMSTTNKLTAYSSVIDDKNVALSNIFNYWLAGTNETVNAEK